MSLCLKIKKLQKITMKKLTLLCFALYSCIHVFSQDESCSLERDRVLCGDQITLVAGDGFESYEWFNSGGDLIAIESTILVTTEGQYTVRKSAPIGSECTMVEETINVISLLEKNNPITNSFDNIVECPSSNVEVGEIYLNDINDSRIIATGITSPVTVKWEVLSSSCTPDSDPNCPVLDNACWVEVEEDSQTSSRTFSEAGQYRLEVLEEGGCFTTYYFNIYKSQLTSETLEVVAIPNNILCFGMGNGSITVNASGGQGDYVYEINTMPGRFQASNEFTNLDAGVYTITTQDKIGNYSIVEVEILEAEQLYMTITSITNQLCFGDSAPSFEIEVEGGTAPYVMSLNGGGLEFEKYVYDNLTSNETYTVLVQDSYGCYVQSRPITLEPTPLSLEVALVNVIPSGNESSGKITLDVTGGIGSYSYYINGEYTTDPDMFFDLEAGTYEIKVEDSNSCFSEAIIVTVTHINIDNSIEVNGDKLEAKYKGAVSYQWINIDSNTRISGATSSVFNPTQYGRYQLEMTIDASSRSGNSEKDTKIRDSQIVLSPIISYEDKLSNEDLVANKVFKLYPNPVIDYFRVPAKLINERYKIYNTLGQEVNNGIIGSQEIKINLLSKGVYLLTVDGYKPVRILKD